jgi:hypothetical protein
MFGYAFFSEVPTCSSFLYIWVTDLKVFQLKKILLLPYRSRGARNMLTGSTDKLKSTKKMNHSRKLPYPVLVCGI